MNQMQALAQAEAQVRAGELAAAERTLLEAWGDMKQASGAALHMLALVRRRQGRLGEAEPLLRRAIEREPGDPRHRLALGDLLRDAGFPALAAECYAEAIRLAPKIPHVRLAHARALLSAGRAPEAEAAARAALAHEPSADAWETLSHALRAQEHFEEALAASDTGAKTFPDSDSVAHGRAVALSRLGRNEEALAEFGRLAARGLDAAALWLNRGVALLGLTRTDAAEAVFAEGVSRWPGDMHLHDALAHTRWMRGDGVAFARDFESAVAHQPDASMLRLKCADLLRRADFRDRAEGLLREGLARAPGDPALSASLGVLLDEMDRVEEGLAHLQSAVRAAPGVAAFRANLTCALLRLGRGDEALAEIMPARVSEPLNQEWICYETMALRQMGDARYHALCDYDAMVRPYDLPAPKGFANVEAFNQALMASLNQLHVLATHPLDQSLRHGSQTTRSLLYVQDPVIQIYLAALAEPIRAYIAAMGVPDPDHPWSGRKTADFKLAGAWSVKLKPKGYHINHLHPAGWISSAYYVALPQAVIDSRDQQGWIKFGEPRWPTPGCSIEKIVQPKAGRLVLFPSYMWHGTIPFDEGERMTAPFDAVPA